MRKLVILREVMDKWKKIIASYRSFNIFFLPQAVGSYTYRTAMGRKYKNG